MAEPLGQVRRPLWTELTSPQPRSTALMVLTLTASFCVLVATWQALDRPHVRTLVGCCALILAILVLRGGLQPRMVPDLTSLLAQLFTSTALGLGLSILTTILLTSQSIAADWVIYLYLSCAATALIGSAIGIGVLRAVWRSGRMRSRALLVGTSRLALEFGIEIANHTSYGVDVVGQVGPHTFQGPVPTLGPYRDLPVLVGANKIDRIFVVPGDTDELIDLMRWANTRSGLDVFVVPRFYEIGLGLQSVSPDRARGLPVVKMGRTTYRATGLVAKRLLDVCLALVGLGLSAPFTVTAAIVIKASSPREPVFFRQERVGRFGRRFEILKFRSMTTATKSNNEWMNEAEARITPVGRLLRKFSIDELPQLLNVLRGDMSIVGPRPERPHFVREFEGIVAGYAARHRMPVGLTGLAQIVGLRGDTSISQRVRFDNIYIDQWRFSWDLEIMIKTAWAVLRAESHGSTEATIENQLQTRIDAAQVEVDAGTAAQFNTYDSIKDRFFNGY